ncbi:IS30 family transposase [Rhodopirellula sp. P2]|uniref:IS30 family transposase n=1 Tax=Rhodopirellula sp. P2 TaxID=2127060 RepID=UPI002367975C|nr:IS30 family transposase [Rhodopirellula sp. P2]WDQ15432.1 IS30 family transposase [Rhodopirellula sp. P2]
MAHLTFHQRVVISVMQRDGKKQKEIAEAIEVSPSTVSRELARNHVTGKHYHPLHAERRANFLKERPSVVSKLEDPDLFEVVSEKLALNWSPEQISGYLSKQAGKLQISHQTIYKYLWSLDRNHPFRKAMRRSGRRNRKQKPGFIRKQAADRVSIHDRPKVASNRKRIGDWELDLVVCKKSTGYLVTAVDRKTGYTLVGRCKKKSSRLVMDTIRSMFNKVPEKHIKTMTFDNGTEFFYHRLLPSWFNVKVFFADPYCSGQRGTNENTNGLLRQYFPKGVDYGSISWQQVRKAAMLLNLRPRKRHGYQTPASLFE